MQKSLGFIIIIMKNQELLYRNWIMGNSGDGGLSIGQVITIQQRRAKCRGKPSIMKKYYIIYLKNNSAPKRGSLPFCGYTKSGRMAGHKEPARPC